MSQEPVKLDEMMVNRKKSDARLTAALWFAIMLMLNMIIATYLKSHVEEVLFLVAWLSLGILLATVTAAYAVTKLVKNNKFLYALMTLFALGLWNLMWSILAGYVMLSLEYVNLGYGMFFFALVVLAPIPVAIIAYYRRLAQPDHDEMTDDEEDEANSLFGIDRLMLVMPLLGMSPKRVRRHFERLEWLLARIYAETGGTDKILEALNETLPLEEKDEAPTEEKPAS
jgi:hypothetical protein